MNYQKDKNLNEVYVFDGGKDEAYFFGTEKSSIPGHIANETLKDGKIVFSDEVRRKYIDPLYADDPEKAKEFEEKFFHGQAKDLDVLEKMIERPNNFKKMIEQKCVEINKENGISEAETEKARKNSKSENSNQHKVALEKNEKQKIPTDVENACKKLGVNQIRGFFYVNAAELTNKVDDTRTNKNGNKVLIIEVYDNKLSCNKYYGFQDEKMVLYGNDSEANQAVKDVTGNVTQMGKMVKPLKAQEDQYIEYEDSDGLVIREKIDEKQETSMQEINQYKKEMEDTLTKYSQKINAIKEDPLLSPEEKKARIQAIGQWCDQKTTELAKENDISMNDDKAINEVTDEHTKQEINKTDEDEIDAWEVPGKIKRGE